VLSKSSLAAQKGTPVGIDPASHAVRSAALVLPEAASFYEAAGDALKATDGVAHTSV
jgi:hypothetical protein